MHDASLEMPLLVTAAVISDGEKILITKRPYDKRHPGLWEFPGGKVDPGESPEEALCREIREELDAEIQVLNIFEVVFHRYEWGPVLVLAYSCRLLTSAIRNLGVTEHRWLYPSELPEFSILPADQPIIDRLIDPSR
ncbi:MAG: (deoxy)nucleoside triphosphate pyrophosphohydrolase [Desulfuromonadales bacterium]|nr:(deoxy)nucleoside triphosphate pyrophosphohydrolase [Desulfuromonadales bacterium]MDH3808049.1 (deoxy)nucleoside triphosphate pyrophosphohydrolase [Desulfuromonadales bacterium]MDH3868091.1 (deoxy)nucleoside triphosphate pyrophosphohydrolase [Desulfuromonadales bacterium]MDH4026074.1 (deoxy)nucleoside triphosphate pyrophosphohydrolase [Desulfuromonadales bacterium]